MKLQKYWRGSRKGNSIANELTNTLLLIYLLVLFWILLLTLGVRFSYMGNNSVNLIPFDKSLDASETILNVVIFLPLGVYAEVLFKSRPLGTKLFFVFLFSLLIEGLQLILRVGAFDITDIITNTLGGIIGLIIFKVLKKLFHNSIRTQKFINIIAAIGTVLMVSLLLFLKLNMLPIKYQ